MARRHVSIIECSVQAMVRSTIMGENVPLLQDVVVNLWQDRQLQMIMYLFTSNQEKTRQPNCSTLPLTVKKYLLSFRDLNVQTYT